MKPSCSSCAHAFREEWSRDTDALRCGYKARPEERAPARADGIPMMKPQSAYGRVTQLFSEGQGSVRGRECTASVVLRALFIHIAETGCTARPVCRGQPPGTDDGRLNTYI